MYTDKEQYYASQIAYFIFNTTITDSFDYNQPLPLNNAFTNYGSIMEDKLKSENTKNSKEIATLNEQLGYLAIGEDEYLLEYKN